MADLPIRVLLVDDHRHIHEAVSLLLQDLDDVELVGQGSNGEEAIRLCQDLRPDVILMDVVMPKMSGVETALRIREQFPKVKILVLSSFQDDETVMSMLHNGAQGYVLKGELAKDLINTIRMTYQGNVVFSPEVARVLLKTSTIEIHNNFDLTERELEVLRAMANGLSNHEIALQLVISQSTVKFHLNNILSKMHVATRAEAIVIAAKNNLV